MRASRAQWVPSRGSNRNEGGPPPLSKFPTKAQCCFGLRSGSFSCHWDKSLVSSHPAGNEILSSSLWLRAIVGVSLRVRHYKPERRLRQCAQKTFVQRGPPSPPWMTCGLEGSPTCVLSPLN